MLLFFYFAYADNPKSYIPGNNIFLFWRQVGYFVYGTNSAAPVKNRSRAHDAPKFLAGSAIDLPSHPAGLNPRWLHVLLGVQLAASSGAAGVHHSEGKTAHVARFV